MQQNRVLLGVNIDHVATVRQARGVQYPDPIKIALDAEEAGADGITLHLREDRRHIQDHDVSLLRELLHTRMNLEIAATEEMVLIAEKIRPQHVCLVPEKREELTTEGGLDVVALEHHLQPICQHLMRQDINVALFIEPECLHIDAAVRCCASTIELHTGTYANTVVGSVEQEQAWLQLKNAVNYGQAQGLVVNAGHGLHYRNVEPIAGIAGIHELNIGHALIARALCVGINLAVKEMKQLLMYASCRPRCL